MEIKIVKAQISLAEVKKMAAESFGDMVKAVVDIEKEIMAVGGEMHADAEALLLADGSKQSDLWGINIYPDLPSDERIEYESLINIRLQQQNKSMSVENEKIREKIKIIVDKLIK
ncbi:MAG: DUF5674 family protein [bacterium]|nr:DUF5674 family protein [bacterium]